MNPKQKAAYLIIKYMSKVVSKNVANECALVAQNVLLEKLKELNIKDIFEEEVLSEINELQ